MYKKIILFVALISLAGTASALPFITGSIDIAGGVTLLDSSNQPTGTSTAVALDFSNPGFVVVSSGSFLSAGAILGTLVNLTDFTFSPSGAVSVQPLWDIPGLFSFDLASVVINTQNATTLGLSGTGIIHGTGFADTAGTWTFSSQTGFSFSSNTAVPEPSAIGLFGIGLCLLYLGTLRRHRSRGTFSF